MTLRRLGKVGALHLHREDFRLRPSLYPVGRGDDFIDREDGAHVDGTIDGLKCARCRFQQEGVGGKGPGISDHLRADDDVGEANLRPQSATESCRQEERRRLK
jgi:hypothetical protein